MDKLTRAIRDLVIANRILANEGVVDAYGHISLRHPEHPDRFLLSRSRSPELVEPEDIMQFSLDGKVVGDDKRPPYLERFIHGGVFESRPEIMAVVHSHAQSVLPYSISSTPLQPVIHVGAILGTHIPIWDIADDFGDTNLLVVNPDQGRSLAKRLGPYSISLMRGHGFTAAGKTLIQALWMAVYLPVNAAVQSEASRLGPFKPLSKREIELGEALDPTSPAMLRSWEYWAKRAGCEALLNDD